MRDTDPTLLICQPAVLVPDQLELALGVQNLWCNELMDLGIDCRPNVYSRPDPQNPSCNQPMFHRTPYALANFGPGGAFGGPGHPDLVLQSQLVLATPHSEGRARIGRPDDERCVAEVPALGGIRVLLRWVCEVIDEAANVCGRQPPRHRWQRLLETKDPYRAAERLDRRGMSVRTGLGLCSPVIEDRVATAEYQATLN